MASFKSARKAIEQGDVVTLRTARSTYYVASIGTRYVHLATGGRIPLTDALDIAIDGSPAHQPKYRMVDGMVDGSERMVVEIHADGRWVEATQEQCWGLVACELADRGLATHCLRWAGDRLAVEQDGRARQSFLFPAKFPSVAAFARALDWVAGYCGG